ncbi:MAG: tRNA-uridine aminocarboxypropyltransferase [Bdellovibrionota bacterium]
MGTSRSFRAHAQRVRLLPFLHASPITFRVTRRRKPEARCDICRMRQEICICPEIAAFKRRWQPRTRVTVLMHHREENLTTNTAHLASLLLPCCEIHLRGEIGKSIDPSLILKSGESPLLLYPSQDAIVLTPELVAALPHPVTLIVPDGSWRQASKVAKREAFLKDVPKVVLSPDAPSRYRLRREPKEEGLGTFEAIARAVGVVEGRALRAELEKVFEEMVERTLRSREGKKPISG